MLTIQQLEDIARARLDDAIALHAANRHDGSVYLCGYAVEVALKVRICRTLGWSGFPETSKEWHDYHSLKTHDLAVLRRFSGKEQEIINDPNHHTNWLVVESWDPETRYRPINSATPASAVLMITASTALLGVLL